MHPLSPPVLLLYACVSGWVGVRAHLARKTWCSFVVLFDEMRAAAAHTYSVSYRKKKSNTLFFFFFFFCHPLFPVWIKPDEERRFVDA